MKTKFIITLTLLCIAVVTSSAQEDDETAQRKVFSMSLRGGFNASNQFAMDEWNDPEAEWRHSFNVGVTCDFRRSEHFVGRTGIYYTEKGFHGPGTGLFLYTHLNYLELPLLAVFQQPIGKLVRLEMQVGPYFSYGVSGDRSVWDGSKKIYNNDGTTELEDIFT